MSEESTAHEQAEDIARVVGVVAALMPAIERAIKREWDKGNYINGPAFGAALERLKAQVDTSRIANTLSD